MRNKRSVETVVSTYDRFSATLTALNILVLMLVVLLLLQWMFGSVESNWSRVEPMEPSTNVMELDGVDFEFVVPEDDRLETMSEDLMSQLTQVSHTASRVVAQLSEHGQGGTGFGDGGGGGSDRRRPPQIPPGGGKSHWSFEVQADSLTAYRELLDELDIEIGVVARSGERIVRLAEFGSRKLRIQESSRADENRRNAYRAFAEKSGGMRKVWDRRLVRESGIGMNDYLICQFYPERLLERLQALEAEALADSGRGREELSLTRFRISHIGGKLELKVLSFEF